MLAKGSLKFFRDVQNMQKTRHWRVSLHTMVFKRLRLHGIIERVPETYKYFPTAYGKEVIATGLAIKNLVLIPALA